MSGSSPQLDLAGLESAKSVATDYGEVSEYNCAFAMPDLEMQDGPCHAEFTELVMAFQGNSYKNVDWFVESIACDDPDHKPFRDRWLRNLVFDPAVTPYPKFVKYLNNTDPLFVITDNYWCFSPVRALEAGFSVKFMLNFLITQRMWREEGYRNMDILRRFEPNSRETMLAVVFSNDRFRFFCGHSPIERWVEGKIQRFLEADPDYNASFSSGVFGKVSICFRDTLKSPIHLFEEFPRFAGGGVDWTKRKKINDIMEPWIRKELIGA